MMTDSKLIRSKILHDADYVTMKTAESLSEVLAMHDFENVMNVSKSAVHVINGHIHYLAENEQSLLMAGSNDIIRNRADFLARRKSIENVLSLIRNDRVGFDFLPQKEIRSLLKIIFSVPVSASLTSNFRELIIGQSINALRYCDTDINNESLAQPCLAISTLFLRNPRDTTASFVVYRLVSLPVVKDEYMYTYSNLPKIVGINFKEKMIVTWNDDCDTSKCLFLEIFQCYQAPIKRRLVDQSCLSELLDNTDSITSMCGITRYVVTDSIPAVIDDNIWLIQNFAHLQQCKLYTHAQSASEVISISIEGPSVLVMPCNETLICTDYTLPPSSCAVHKSMLIYRHSSIVNSHELILLPINNLSDTMVASYQTQADRVFNEFVAKLKNGTPKYKRIFENF